LTEPLLCGKLQAYLGSTSIAINCCLIPFLQLTTDDEQLTRNGFKSN
jgi:hypothetical protein